jgi:hypothetical protein
MLYTNSQKGQSSGVTAINFIQNVIEYPTLQVKSMKLLGFINVSFDVTAQLVIRFSAFIKCWRKKWEFNETIYQLFTDFKKAHDSLRREVQYSIFIEFRVSRTSQAD